MAVNHREYRILPGLIEYYIDKTRNITASGLKYYISGEQPIPNGLLFILYHCASFTSWGENIKLALIWQGDQTVVDIDSECALATQVIDWGNNRKNVAALFNYLEQGIPPFQQGAAQPPRNETGLRQADTGGRVICPNCGRTADSTETFCSACGTRLR